MSGLPAIIGRGGEDIATEWLRERGYYIVERNWRIGHYEIDIIAQKGRYIVFVEVKSRKEEYTETYGRPATAVNYTKREHIRYAMKNYILRNNIKHIPRIDVIEVYLSEKGHRIEHIKNAFGAQG